MFKVGDKEYTFKFGDKVDRGDNDLIGSYYAGLY